MSGHSKWSTIKRKKGAADAKRGKVFSKIIKEICVAAKMGGSDPEGNPRLRTVIDKAKSVNMPNDNIERAIKKGAGELEGVTYDESTYEGYGPGGVALMIETLTDNKNRTVADIRHLLSKGGGSLGENGCVGWMFKKKGMIIFDKDSVDEEKLMEVAIDAGAEDIKEMDDTFEVETTPESFLSVKEKIDTAGLKAAEADIQMIPQNLVKLEGDAAVKMLRLMENIEDCDDVQNVYANFDIDDDVLESV